MIASAQDGPRATMGAMATSAFGGKQAPLFVKGGGRAKSGSKGKGKIRPGSIPSGQGRGKFPITSQKSVKSAASLLHNAKGVSRQTIIRHVRAEAKRRGLRLTPVFKGRSSR